MNESSASYWQSLAELMNSNGRTEIAGMDPVAQKARAQFLFQKGIAKYMTGQNLAGNKNFFKAHEILQSFSFRHLGYEDWMRIFFIRWIKDNVEDTKLITESRRRLEADLTASARASEDPSFLKGAKKLGFVSSAGNVLDNINETGATDKYALESFADLLTAYGRVSLMEGAFQLTLDAAALAQEFYRKAIIRAHSMVEEEFPHLAGCRDKTDAALQKEKPELAEEIIEKRIVFRGNIPDGRTQCELLADIAGFLIRQGSSRPHLIQKKFDLFLNETVNPHLRDEPVLGLLEELQWVYVRKRYSYTLYNMPLESDAISSLKKILG